mmetsp:Transcript_32382/g.59149  ORF Transcript_32382/g.59149 Transcript_32382/m.59149 type:complete len:263 (-) Transcript_32382:57-845(-)
MAARDLSGASGVRLKPKAASKKTPQPSVSIDLWRPLACCQAEPVQEESYGVHDPDAWEEDEFDLNDLNQSMNRCCQIQEGVTCSDVLVIVDRSNGESLGIEVTLLEDDVLLIESIHAGLIDDWNAGNPSQAVQVGDSIVAVNGSRVSQKMLRDCRRKQALYLLVRRCQQPVEHTLLEFMITLDRTDGKRLGIDVDHQDGVQLLIEEIEGGLVEEWNNEHPEQAVCEGDCITEVNGISEDVPKMLEQCMKKGIVNIKIRRDTR